MNVNRRDFLRHAAASSSAAALLCSGTGAWAEGDKVSVMGKGAVAAEEAWGGWLGLEAFEENVEAVIEAVMKKVERDTAAASVVRIPVKDIVQDAPDDGRSVTVMYVSAKSMPDGLAWGGEDIAILAFPPGDAASAPGGEGGKIGIVRIPVKESVAKESPSYEVVELPTKGEFFKKLYFLAALNTLLGGDSISVPVGAIPYWSAASVADAMHGSDWGIQRINTGSVREPSPDCLLNKAGWSACFGVSDEPVPWYKEARMMEKELKIEKSPPRFWELRSLSPEKYAEHLH